MGQQRWSTVLERQDEARWEQLRGEGKWLKREIVGGGSI